VARAGIPASVWADIAVLVVLTAVAAVGFQTVFGPGAYLVAAGGGMLIGGASALLGRVLRLPVVAGVALAVVAFMLFGTAFALPGEGLFGVVPSVQSLIDLARGAVFGWRDAVTLHAPLQAPPYLAVVPFAATWLTSLFGVSVALRMPPTGRHPVARVALIAAGPAAVFIATVLLGTQDAVFAAARGVAFAVIALVWAGWRVRAARPAVPGGRSRARTAFLSGAGIIAGALVVGVVGGTLIAPPAASRIVVRDHVQPPFDPLQYPAPLAGFRKYTKDLHATKLFALAGVRQGQYVRLVTMDSYNGVVWSVAGAQENSGGATGFRLYGSDIPQRALTGSVLRSTATVTIEGYKDVWLPTPGYATRLAFDGSGSSALAQSARVNVDSGTAAVMRGLHRGDSYTIDVATPKIPTDTALRDVAVANVSLPSVANVPDVIGAKADEWAGNASSAVEKLRNVERSFKKLGYLSHGRASDSVPSSAGEGADRMTDLLTTSPMVGDQEQYASAFALMARHLGYGARVVLGFKPKVHGGTATVTGNDVTAWVEVPFEGVGWVPFFPTPDKMDAPKEQSVKPKLVPQPQVRQPPRTVHKDDDLLTPVKTKNESTKKKKDAEVAFVVPTWAYYLGGALLILAAAYFGPLLAIAAVKARRRRRRARGSGDRSAAGAWSELVDRYAELGLTPPSPATRLQVADALNVQAASRSLVLPDGGLAPLAARVDAVVFDGSAVSPEHAAEVWAAVDASVEKSLDATGWLQRRLAAFRLAPRSNRVRRPVASV
jgi:hypothetical protein